MPLTSFGEVNSGFVATVGGADGLLLELRRDLGLRSLTYVVTGTIGSGWLLLPPFRGPQCRCCQPAGLVNRWCDRLFVALVFAELGSGINSSGAWRRFLLSHGRLSGFIGGWSIWITYLCVPTIELLAMIDYLASSVPGSQMLAVWRCSAVWGWRSHRFDAAVHLDQPERCGQPGALIDSITI